MGIEEDISSGSSSASRIGIWEYALNHFYDSPLFGSSLEVPETGHYPHNIYIEVLMTTGIVGFIPFMFIIVKTMLQSLYIFKHKPELSWIAAIFLQNIIQNSFSGAIYGASWLFVSMAMVLCVDFRSEVATTQRVQVFGRKRVGAGA
ncbi:hypothetical protein GCM10023188_37030 [Pontibacter saemangeumensis]|uniref:O-antigen ligase-related domain-containing protein n=2 Tax=Pontibacter saemangeumensis TaxID=1084525 RepID=A0ABP8LYZ8_9BACT